MREAMDDSSKIQMLEAVPYAMERFLEAPLPQVLSAPPDMHPQSSEHEEDELPPLLYARQHGLCRDYLQAPLGWSDLQDLQRKAAGAVYEDSNLPLFNFGAELKIEERLTCSKEAAVILSWVANETFAKDGDALINAHFNAPSSNRIQKLELPLLRTDHETDCRDFANREGFEIKLRDVKLPLEAVRDEEGLDWTSKFAHLGAEVSQELKQERIGITRDTMSFLQQSLAVFLTEDDEKSLWDTQQTYKRKTIFEPITPPLSPLPVKPEPFEPAEDDPAFHVPILSDAISPTKQDLEAIEKELFQQDIPTPPRLIVQPSLNNLDSSSGTMSLEEVYPPLASLDNSPKIKEEKRVKLGDLKVEEPMTPKMRAPTHKFVRFSNIIEQLDIKPSSSPRTPPGTSTFFKEVFGPAYESVNQQLEQETLIRADTTARVDVRVMDFRKPDPPWHKFDQIKEPSALLELQKSFIRETVRSIPTWPGSGKRDSSLPWSPFTSEFAKLALEEEYQDNNSTWKPFVKDDQDAIDSSSLIWKQPGLKILRDGKDDDDDEIEPGQIQTDSPQDLSFIVKKRKMELQERDNFRKNNPVEGNNVPAVSGFTPINKPKHSASTSNSATGQLVSGELGMLGSQFSAEASLNHYLELRGAKRPKLTDSIYFGSTTKALVPGSQPLIVATPQQAGIPIRTSPLMKQEKLPIPIIAPSNTAANIIISSTLLKNRALIKHIESQLPSLKLVERDFTAHNTSTWMPGSVTRSPVKSPLDSEADLILSPTTGIILTTLQKIKQRALPGQSQKSKPAIRERLERVCPRYEKLVVFVSEGNLDESTNGLDDSDCLALAEFIGFASAFETAVGVHFVGGGDATLARWIASVVVQHPADTELLPEETHWEMFLRRAGLNAFAAQAVSADLKAPEGVNVASPSQAERFGLAAFMKMGRQERITRLGGHVGRRVLERVGAAIDTAWE
ncbi:uncharacterized protein L3040_004791 [Drepanopeziza brunnea f. sp. 'multigermtubi']|nr:hypothetical protein L3040_004791 [Drepanopeziza brunnea f. sp. 'multigermtubi']